MALLRHLFWWNKIHIVGLTSKEDFRGMIHNMKEKTVQLIWDGLRSKNQSTWKCCPWETSLNQASKGNWAGLKQRRVIGMGCIFGALPTKICKNVPINYDPAALPSEIKCPVPHLCGSQNRSGHCGENLLPLPGTEPTSWSSSPQSSKLYYCEIQIRYEMKR
jgi:hypothetical protein